jgi:hypothetical protein
MDFIALIDFTGYSVALGAVLGCWLALKKAKKRKPKGKK